MIPYGCKRVYGKGIRTWRRNGGKIHVGYMPVKSKKSARRSNIEVPNAL